MANFKQFLEERETDKPFFFWYGASEPHRDFEQDSWKRHGKSLDFVEVPEFLSDHPVVRGDLLDYAVEIEWFDLHLMRMIEHLEEIGELDNTIIVVTSDNGMAFPRAKANAYEYGVHVPLETILAPFRPKTDSYCTPPYTFDLDASSNSAFRDCRDTCWAMASHLS